MTEYFWVVDEDDQVIGKETRENCHNLHLIHRSVYIFVHNSNRELFIQKRSMMKDLYPGFYTGSATGHVNYGETYEQAAIRELEEELGIKVPLTRLGKFTSFSLIEKEISTVYLSTYDGEISINEQEISQGFFLNLQQIEDDINQGKKPFPVGFQMALNVYKTSM
jgi:isopentenyl-diphosphate delta-isomerase type 1